MKKFSLIIFVCLLAALGSIAQCDTSALDLHTVRQDMLNEKDSVMDAQDDAAKINIGKEQIVITKDNGENIMTATIIRKDCKWKEKLKDGKSVYDLKLVFPDGNESTGTASLEGKDGNLVFLLTFERLQGRKIKAYIDKM